MQLIDVMFQANKIDKVKAKIGEVAMNSPDDHASPESTLQRLPDRHRRAFPDGEGFEDVVKKLDEVIARPTADNAVKALAFNVMGDCYQAQKRPRDAMWSYLWVDVVYSQDRSEHLKALNKLLKIFEDERDLDKIQLMKEKIARLR